jgi:hypothetical protein
MIANVSNSIAARALRCHITPMADYDEAGTCNSALAVRLLLLDDEAELKSLARAGWIRPIAPGRWRTADIVQGRIKQLLALTTTYNAEQMAEALALTHQRVRQLTVEGRLKTVSKGKYDRDATTRDYVVYLREQNTVANQSTSESRVREARAQEIELRTQQRLFQLVPRAVYEDMIDTFAGSVRSEFAGLPAASTRDLPMRRIIEREVNARLRRIAEQAMAQALRLEAMGHADDAVGADGARPVGGGEPDLSPNGGSAGPT